MESALLFIALIIALLFGWSMFGGILQLLMALVLWMFIGNIAGHIIRGEDYGVASNIALGLVGGIVGAVLIRLIGLGGILHIWLLGPVLAGVIGAVITVYLTRWIVDSSAKK